MMEKPNDVRYTTIDSRFGIVRRLFVKKAGRLKITASVFDELILVEALFRGSFKTHRAELTLFDEKAENKEPSSMGSLSVTLFHG